MTTALRQNLALKPTPRSDVPNTGAPPPQVLCKPGAPPPAPAVSSPPSADARARIGGRAQAVPPAVGACMPDANAKLRQVLEKLDSGLREIHGETQGGRYYANAMRARAHQALGAAREALWQHPRREVVDALALLEQKIEQPTVARGRELVRLAGLDDPLDYAFAALNGIADLVDEISVIRLVSCVSSGAAPGDLSHYLGTREYYEARFEDFACRHPGKAPPSYYFAYGTKYLKRFSDETFAKLSPAGQAWLVKARANLQEAIEDLRARDPDAFDRLEQDGEAFKRFAFATHKDAYLDAGLAGLPLGDLARIGFTPDLRDLLSPDGLRQAAETGEEVIERWIK